MDEVKNSCALYIPYLDDLTCFTKDQYNFILNRTKEKEKKMRAIVTPDDLKIGELLEPGQYLMELSNYEEKEATKDKSTNCVFTFKVVDGPFKGYSARVMFNEKALAMGKKLWAALALPFDKERGYQLSTELFEQVALNHPKLKVYIKRGKTDRGNEFNEPVDFFPVG